MLYQEIIHAFQPDTSGRFVDCTLGAGGHAWGILNASTPDGMLLGLEVDPQALKLASLRLKSFDERAVLVRASYATLEKQLEKLGWPLVDGILLDLGISSMQLDTPERGFSFLSDAPLDMRFDPDGTITAADLVNGLSERELADLIFRYGEEPLANRIAKMIVNSRPITRTVELADLISKVAGRRRGGGSRDDELHQRIHPATLTFQALRIAVNHELDSLESVLPQAVRVLRSGARLAVISFHSLEDRIVKQFFRQEGKDCICPPKQPVCTCGHRATLQEMNRRPIFPTADEVRNNPRARSARLRVVIRL